jgi:chaperonin cofactor prefoldin
MEVRRQLSQALAAQAELRALVEELQARIATLERRCAELEQQLERALSLAEAREPPTGVPSWAADSAARVQAHESILKAELEQVRRQRTEIAEQLDRLTTRLASLLLSDSGTATGPSADYSAARTELFSQMRCELEVRDRHANWEIEHRARETDRRIDPARTLDEQALTAALAVRWQLMDHAPQCFRLRPRWVVEGLLLDPASEQFLIRQSRERVAYRERNMASGKATVA